MSSAEGSRSLLPATRARPVSIHRGTDGGEELIHSPADARATGFCEQRASRKASLGEKVRRGGWSFQTILKPASVCRRQHDSESRAPGPCGIKPPGTPSGVHLLWQAFGTHGGRRWDGASFLDVQIFLWLPKRFMRNQGRLVTVVLAVMYWQHF